jgi:tetraacyldisaccharide 4'-kinase
VEAAVHRETNAPIFYAQAELDSVYSPSSTHLESHDAREQDLFAFCGVGNPAAFVADLRSCGFKVVGHKFFPDHHRYSPADVREIEAEARVSGASGLICTEKDRFNFPCSSAAMDLWVCAISLRIEREQDFWRTMLAAIESCKAGLAQ